MPKHVKVNKKAALPPNANRGAVRTIEKAKVMKKRRGNPMAARLDALLPTSQHEGGDIQAKAVKHSQPKEYRAKAAKLETSIVRPKKR